MKILLTTDTWVPTINGVVTSTATLRAALTAQGHEVRVLPATAIPIQRTV